MIKKVNGKKRKRRKRKKSKKEVVKEGDERYRKEGKEGERRIQGGRRGTGRGTQQEGVVVPGWNTITKLCLTPTLASPTENFWRRTGQRELVGGIHS